MTEAESIAVRIAGQLPRLKSGTLRIWGQWFGRPHDNLHTAVESTATEDFLRVAFDQGETLTVFEPTQAMLTEDVFRIVGASWVRWEWFYYGRPRSPENLRFMEHTRSGGKIVLSTNVDWYRPGSEADPRLPAVELL